MRINYPYFVSTQSASLRSLVLLIAFFLLLSFIGFSQTATTVNIPDANFRAILVEKSGIRTGVGTNIIVDDISAITSLNVMSKNISSLSGIEAFTALEDLYCNDNQLTELNVSENTILLGLYCESNQLTILDVSENTALEYFSCSDNQLTILDVSENMALTALSCKGNQLQELNVSENTALMQLYCYDNRLQELNVSENTALIQLYCNDNQLTELNVSENTALRKLYCQNNQLMSLNLKNRNNNILEIFEATNNQNLICIQVDDASISIPAGWVDDTTASYANVCATASNEDFKLSRVFISPNPSSGILNITVVEKADYKLLNIRGKTLKTGVLKIGESEINLSPFARGVYLLNIKTNRGSFTKKVVRN